MPERASKELLRRGDEVELVSVPLGRAGRLKVGMVGVVVVPPDGQEFHWVSVLFPPALRPHLLAQRHLRRTGAHQDLDAESDRAADAPTPPGRSD